MKLALFTAGVDGDNSGDAIIETAVRRLVGTENVIRLPLVGTIGEAHIAEANRADAALICGTNLYQAQFMCGLTAEVVEQIRVPLIPFGIGSSAAMGEIPTMDAAGVAAVRAVHRKCRLGSVRDAASLAFLRSIGIQNAVLTGCPVLFHGLGCPDFRPSGDGYTLAPRARLLHIDSRWQRRQLETLEILAKRYRPKLVLQSPYDLEISEPLAKRYGLEMLLDDAWQAAPYIEAAKAQRVSLGFRLHFAMLSIAYGKPAYLVSHDSRADEFAKLMGLPPLRIDSYSDALLGLKIDANDFPADAVRRRWTELGREMAAFMRANELPCRLEVDETPLRPLRRKPLARKPHVTILVDKPNWAYDHSMRKIRHELQGEFDITLKYRTENPVIDPKECDLVHVCFWGEEYHRKQSVPPEKVVKEVSSHRWQFKSEWGPISAEEFAARHLGDCETAICTSLRLKELVEPHTKARVLHTPNGVEIARFKSGRRSGDGPLVYGWAGNATDPVKRFEEIVLPATQGRKLVTATGDVGHTGMPGFYASADVYLVTSAHEGEPLTLIEAMAAGCFPVCVDVGIVPELIRHQENGLIVSDPTAEAFQRAFAWCEANQDKVRAAGHANAEAMARERNWPVCAQFFARAYKEALAPILAPKFRNDDVAWNTSLPALERFSLVFQKYGLRQVHGICLNGRNNAAFRHGNDAVEYDGQPNLSHLPYAQIVELSQGKPIAERRDLVAWLNQCPDELALHGLYHTDYSKMSREEQARDIAEGLRLMRQLFPKKRVRYFIAPFNRTNSYTYRVAERYGLSVLADQGVHLEHAVHEGTLTIEPEVWYRYHHHRFYPESQFKDFNLSIERLDEALGACFSTQPRALDLKIASAPRVAIPDWRNWKAELRRYHSLRVIKRAVRRALQLG